MEDRQRWHGGDLGRQRTRGGREGDQQACFGHRGPGGERDQPAMRQESGGSLRPVSHASPQED
jgi:hypothetical protein